MVWNTHSSLGVWTGLSRPEIWPGAPSGSRGTRILWNGLLGSLLPGPDTHASALGICSRSLVQTRWRGLRKAEPLETLGFKSQLYSLIRLTFSPSTHIQFSKANKDCISGVWLEWRTSKALFYLRNLESHNKDFEKARLSPFLSLSL